jgi:hypothetical protein
MSVPTSHMPHRYGHTPHRYGHRVGWLVALSCSGRGVTATISIVGYLLTEPQHMRGRASARFILIINVAELLPGGFGALFDVGRFTARILIRARGGICITTKAAPMSSADQGGGKRRADCIASRSVAVLISGP